MYAYIFDSFLQERKYQHEVVQIENRLATLGIQGKSEKMTILKNIQEAAKQAMKRGATTLVVIGNDETITKVLPHVIGTSVTFGIIPVGPHQTIASILGIPTGVSACDTLSRRVVRHIDLGKAGASYFLFHMTAPANVQVDCGSYSVTSLDPNGTITIANFPIDGQGGKPDDGVLELMVVPGEEKRGWGGLKRRPQGSIFPVKKVKIHATGIPAHLTLDGQTTVKTPMTIEIADAKLEVIVGKERAF